MINLDYLREAYFCFDKPVPYQISGKEILIYPVLLEYSLLFLTSVSVLCIDKNSSDSVEVIQMPYLDYICKVLIKGEHGDLFSQQLFFILNSCLKIKNPMVGTKADGHSFILDDENGVEIGCAEFDEIKQIILYQNLLHYDDTYIDPDLKKAMQEEDELRNINYEVPSMERKIAIISAHNGMQKKEQMEMTYRSHCLLWEEVCGEIDFVTTRPIALYTGSTDKMEHWIFKNKKNKYGKYITSIDDFAGKMGSNANAIVNSSSNLGEQYMQQFNNFSK